MRGTIYYFENSGRSNWSDFSMIVLGYIPSPPVVGNIVFPGGAIQAPLVLPPTTFVIEKKDRNIKDGSYPALDYWPSEVQLRKKLEDGGYAAFLFIGFALDADGKEIKCQTYFNPNYDLGPSEPFRQPIPFSA
jgi:hypothetical protein